MKELIEGRDMMRGTKGRTERERKHIIERRAKVEDDDDEDNSDAEERRYAMKKKLKMNDQPHNNI